MKTWQKHAHKDNGLEIIFVSVKGHMVNSLVFVVHKVFVKAIQFCWYNAKAAIDNM